MLTQTQCGVRQVLSLRDLMKTVLVCYIYKHTQFKVRLVSSIIFHEIKYCNSLFVTNLFSLG